MRKVWNEVEHEWEYIEDDVEAPKIEPKRAVVTLDELKAIVAPTAQANRTTGQSERNRRWRINNPEKHRIYRLEYMRRYRAKGQQAS